MKRVIIVLIFILFYSTAHALPVLYTVSGYTYEYPSWTRHDLIGSIWLDEPVVYTRSSGLEWVRFDILDLYFYTEPMTYQGTGYLDLNTNYGPVDYYITLEIEGISTWGYDHVTIYSQDPHPIYPNWPSPYIFPYSFDFRAETTATENRRVFIGSASMSASVPEPATMLLLSFGVISWAWHRRRKGQH